MTTTTPRPDFPESGTIPRPTVLAWKLTLALAVSALWTTPAHGEIQMIKKAPDPHGIPRPMPGSEFVPTETSFYFKLAWVAGQNEPAETIDPDSITVRLESEGAEPLLLLKKGGELASGVSGSIREMEIGGNPGVAVSLDPETILKPGTTYTVQIHAQTKEGSAFVETESFYRPMLMTFRATGGEARPAGPETWTFTTEPTTEVYEVVMPLDLSQKPVHWHGAFFSGVCNVQFCTSEELYGPTYELMREARRDHPNAWSFQRDFWLTGTAYRPSIIFTETLPNIVREKETRRIHSIERTDEGVLLRLEEYFGHQQYGVESGRPLSEDYQPGYTVMVADGIHDARAEVLAVDDQAGTLLLDALPSVEGGWQIDYTAPLPEAEAPDFPGLFPSGGAYLRRFDPHGTAVYYWGRLDKEWDLVHGTYQRRVLPNFVDATGCLSKTGRTGYPPKDYAQWHETVREITGHIIARYGEASLDFVWSIFNEPDLKRFWNQNPEELLRFYDYTADGILRAFEDHGYDSEEVFIGGLELGAIFGVQMRLEDFLAHCSPNVDDGGPGNAAYADPRLDRKRSNRVQAMGDAHEGRGSPLDFISIHLYNRSELAAEKMIAAKQTALEIDEDYYAKLWINSHEACPDWSPPSDPAAADSYLGNGYFKSWTIDLVARLLRKAAEDSRFSYGETIMTVWPPLNNFQGLNAVTRRLDVDETGDGQADSTRTIPVPLFHVMTLLSDFHGDFYLLPHHEINGYSVGGFATTEPDGTLRVMLYSHAPADTQSRSRTSFTIDLALEGLQMPGDQVRITQYRFDRHHNSYFQPAVQHRKGPGDLPVEALNKVFSQLAENGTAAREFAMEQLDAISHTNKTGLLEQITKFVRTAGDKELRQHGASLRNVDFASLLGGGPLSAAEADRFEELAQLRPTDVSTHGLEEGTLPKLTFSVTGNGLNLVILEPITDLHP